MARFWTILFTLPWTVLDIAVTTTLLCHGKNFRENFSLSVYAYSFTDSLFDVWILVLLRISVVLGLQGGMLLNPEEGSRRSRRLQMLVLAGVLFQWMWATIKLLALADHPHNLEDSWMWGMLGWTAGSSACMYLIWLLLGRPPTLRSHVLSVNADEERPLLGDKVHDESKTGGGKKDEEVKFRRVTVWRLLKFSRPDLPLIVVAFTFLTVAATGEIFLPLYTGKVIEGIALDKSQEKFTQAIIVLAIIQLAVATASGLRGGIFSLTLARLNIRIRNQLFASIMKQEIGFFDSTKTGDITSRLTADVTKMSDAVSLNLNIFLRSVIKGVGVLVFMLKLSWRMSFVTFIGFPLIVGISKVYGKYYEELSSKVQDSLAKANNVAEEACSSMRTVRSFANEDGEVAQYVKALQITFSLNKRQAILYAGYTWCNQILWLSLTVSMLYYGGHLVVTNQLTVSNLVTFILYQIELGTCLSSIGNVYTGLMEALGASEKVFQYMDRKPGIPNAGKLAPDNLKGYLEFQNISFAYPSRPDTQVLKNVSFKVAPGEVVALVGPSGGGKSSCVSLLEHFYEANSGAVLLDGKPVQDYDHRYLHTKIALVGQEPVLFARSVRDNIAYAMEDCPDSLVEEAARLANAHQFISETRDKYSTETGEKGLLLSGGQKQRVAIARALIRQPMVMILDEATSALDSESEHLVQQAIYSNVKNRTVVIVAHRLSTVEKADRIMVVDRGKIVEQGSHRDLLAHEGLYYRLVQRQLLLGGNLDDTDLVFSSKPIRERSGATISQTSVQLATSASSLKSASP